MSTIGFVGLPQSGKTTLFDVLTGLHREMGFAAGQQVNTASIKIPDERHDKLCEIFKPKKSVLAGINITDVPGVLPDDDASRNEGAKSPGELLAALRQADALVAVVCGFAGESVVHPHGGVDALRDVGEVKTLLLLTDLDIAEKRIAKLKALINKPTKTQESNKKELALLERLHPYLESGDGLDGAQISTEEEITLRTFAFLTRKPMMVLVNIDEGQSADDECFAGLLAEYPDTFFFQAKLRQEIAELDEADREQFVEEMGLETHAKEKLIQRFSNLLGIRVFFTVSADEVRAWMINSGDNAQRAAGKVHTDMERGFIRAEVVGYDDFMECGSEREAKARNKVRLEGKEYIVLDGDIIFFRFSA